MNGAKRHGRPSNVARRVRAGARLKLWTSADKLRSNLDAAVYKHAVLGLIFLKYVSDSFAQRQAEITVKNGKTETSPPHSASTTGYKITSTGKLIDDALETRYWKPPYAPT
jgi:type I restriction-modification system DNA methylase subunit